MTDWDEIRENIARATRSCAQFQEIGQTVIETPEQVSAREFAARLTALQKELENILKQLSPGSTIALDEIADAFSRLTHGRPAAYRITPSLSAKGER